MYVIDLFDMQSEQDDHAGTQQIINIIVSLYLKIWKTKDTKEVYLDPISGPL